ncbi:hypothetical protein SNE26_02220 [Mucilaginibacter sp. cycad4]|uniref:hypothetical protein n=1 Tax=Mucilaginibacter sp. cycad4 TaxID=3342096 RepID=UPI002AAC2F06|nr:hypothetical protein [Mucilaginibacter gossypii]WPV00580.1 hypothetical protein SNE26_02220 [Mucilaginibacter gossypii]
MAEHLIINEDDFDYFNRLVNSAVRDGFEIVSSSSHWDYERNKTIYHALAVDKNPQIRYEEDDDDEMDYLIPETPIKQEKRIELSTVEYLLKFATKKDLTGFCTAKGENEIKPEWDEDNQPLNSLGRVFNRRRGFLSLAAFTDDNVLLINDFLLNSGELRDLTYNLENNNINFKVIHFSPDDFDRECGLVSHFEYLNRMQKIQQEKTNVNFLQWLFK